MPSKTSKKPVSLKTSKQKNIKYESSNDTSDTDYDSESESFDESESLNESESSSDSVLNTSESDSESSSDESEDQLENVKSVPKKKYGKDIREIIIEPINDDYSWGKYADFDVIIMNKNGFINSKTTFGHGL